jgi:hypothetical protein
LFGEVESKAKNSRVAHEHTGTENMTSLYWFGPSESKTLRPVVGVDCLRIAYCTRVTSLALYWPADEVGSQTPGRLRPRDLNLYYNTCHICQWAWSKPTEVLSCTPSLEVVLNKDVLGIFWKVFRRSCGPPTRSVGSTNRSAGLLVGQTHLSGWS